jgi:hypothetical protein
MPIACLLAFFSVLLLQAIGTSPMQGDIFLPSEKAQIEQADGIERRIKVYEAASKRIHQSLEAAIVKDDFHTVPDNLQRWTSLLAKSMEDIEANLKAKKKSRALIRYEIQVRKSISRTESLKIRAPVDQQDIFNACIAQAEKVRKRFVEILFRH